MKVRFLSSILGVVGLLFATGGAAARPLANPIGTAFTYQGRLKDGAVAANGLYDFEFRLYDDLSGGAQMGALVALDDVNVSDGLFTAQLNFGDVFDGTALWLEIGVRPGGEAGAYTTLTPRQPLTPAPYALYAVKAPWSGLSGVPAGFADGADNGSAHHIKVVAKSGGDYTTITAALDSILDASTTNRYLVYVAPGVYTEQVTMKQYVDIEGAGELATKITYTGFSSDNDGTLKGTSSAELRFLTVENTGGNIAAIAIYGNSVSPRLTHVTATASGGTVANRGLYCLQCEATMTNFTARASGGSEAKGLNLVFGNATLTNVSLSAEGATAANIGLYNAGSFATIADSSISASGGTESYGVFNWAPSDYYTVLMRNSEVSGATNAIMNDSHFTMGIGASKLRGGPVDANGGSVLCAGVYDEDYAFYASTCP